MNSEENKNIAKSFPKVLIIGQTFTTDTGGGITLTNLFKNWPQNKLAVAVESKEALDFSKSDNYYRLGFAEQAMPFPFSLLQRKTKSGVVTENFASGAVMVKQTKPLKARLKNSFDNVLHSLGLYLWMYGKQKLRTDFLNWFKEFNPDIIYYQPNSYKSIGFVTELKKLSKKPLVIHVMDDWFSFAVKPSLLKSYWENKFDQKIRTLFENSQVHLSICQFMADVYLERYGHTFYPYHNSVDLDFWMNTHSLEIKENDPFHLLYAGRVGYGLENTLLTTASVVEKMNKEGVKIYLEIQTKDGNHPLTKSLKKYKSVKIAATIPYKDLPKKFASADALLIPCDFDEEGLRFIRYSMPTKVSEYMASGTPIFVVGPSGTALVEYAKEGWAQICDQPDALEIKKSLQELIFSPSLRENRVKKAHELVKENHSELENTERFKKMMNALKEKSTAQVPA